MYWESFFWCPSNKNPTYAFGSTSGPLSFGNSHFNSQMGARRPGNQRDTFCSGGPLEVRGPLSESCWGLLFGLLKGVLKVSSGTVQWHRSSYGTDFDSSEVASPVRICSAVAKAPFSDPESQMLHTGDSSSRRLAGWHIFTEPRRSCRLRKRFEAAERLSTAIL